MPSEYEMQVNLEMLLSFMALMHRISVKDLHHRELIN